MLRKIDVRYDATADRLIVLAEMASGEGPRHHGVQLTRRIWAATREALFLHFVASTPSGAATAAPQPPPSDPSTPPAHAASSGLPSLPPGPPSEAPPPPSSLPVAVGVQCSRRRSDGLWLLTLPCDGRPTITLVLSDTTLRALAKALFQQEARASWQLPSLSEATGQAAGTASTALH
jgi:hypothetical protein